MTKHCATREIFSGTRALPVSNVRSVECDATIVEIIPALRAFARTFCRNPTDADDLVQDTLMKGLANIDKFETGTRMKSWLFTIMRNTFYTKIKAYVREAPGGEACISDRPAVEAPQEWSIRSREVRDAIDRLPRHQQEVLVLVGVLGTSYEDTASICNCTVGTIKSRLNRARIQVLEYLGEATSGTLVESPDNFTSKKFSADQQRRS